MIASPSRKPADHPVKVAYLRVILATELLKQTFSRDTNEHERLFYERERLVNELSDELAATTGITAEQIAEVLS